MEPEPWKEASEQMTNAALSTLSPSMDIVGSEPYDLYGIYTWKIEKFSEIAKEELRSNAFDVGGRKWSILIYPQGSDVCNHLSLFLCVANHDKLLPGWSHLAQFTISVVNKDSKKSKYCDTLHRFWSKEHDWGWKKFMELSKLSDGFLDDDTLIIRAQIQVIRDNADHPFCCLNSQYKGELLRVYLTNVEQIFWRFKEERRGKLRKLIENKARWSSFCSFWSGIDQNARHDISREKRNMMLEIIVNHFFIEKEVTSALVMDSLYSGLKDLEGQMEQLDAEKAPTSMVKVEKDMFLIADNVLLVLERAALKPFPMLGKGPQNRMMGDISGENVTELDEKCLTELGRRTLEIFIISHIFSHKIEVAYEEALAQQSKLTSAM